MFSGDWLVIDVRLKADVTIEQLGIPAAGQYCDPRRPTTIVPAGIGGENWSAMLIRPDFYLYGGAADGPALGLLARALCDDLARAGVRLCALKSKEEL